MTLVDPDSRWWRSNRARSLLAHAMAMLGVLLAFVGNATLFGQLGTQVDLLRGAGETGETASAVVGVVGVVSMFVAIPLVVGGLLVHSFLVDGDGDLPLLLRWALPLYFIASGLGMLTAALITALGPSPRSAASGTAVNYALAVVFTVGGLIAIIAIEIHRARRQSTATASLRTQRQGVRARAVVTRAKSYTLNYQPVTRVTVSFTDRDGRIRYARDTVPGTIAVGRPLTVRYSPADLGRRGGVVIVSGL